MTYLIPWAFVVLAALMLKHRLLAAEGGGFDFVAEVMGLGHGGALSALQRFALYREDLLLALIVGPLALLALLRMVSPRFRALVAGGVSAVLFVILYAELKAYWEVGTFVSARLLADGLFGSGRELIGVYLASTTVLKLALALAALCGTTVALSMLQRRGGRRFRSPRPAILATAVGGAAALLVLVSSLTRVPATPFERSAGLAALVAFARGGDVVALPTEFRDLQPRDLVAAYGRLTGAPVPNQSSQYWGRARDYDVVFLLFESLPFACTRLAAASRALPNLRALERTAFVPDAHYATYPYSRRAYGSIYSSWYPLNGIRGSFERFGLQSRDLRSPGVAHSTAVAGYETAAFVPERPVGLEEDELRYSALGFASHEVPPSAYEKPEGFELDDSHRDWVRVRDREAFDRLKQRAGEAIDADRRYFYSFNPQLTHGPWPNLTPASTRDETCAAGLALFREVDAMLGELVDLLRQKGRLDHTIIVALGDHGLRTRREYPPFHAGTLDDVTFHVPLVLFAPGVVDSTVRIPWMTSHIDITPSVLDLLGLTVDRDLELGSPMWDPRLAGRTTYFFAKGYLGSDGFQRNHEAVMVRYLFGGVSRSRWDGALRFAMSDLSREADTASLRAVENLELMAAIQNRLSQTLLPGVWALTAPAEPIHRASGGSVLVTPGGVSADSGHRP